MEEALKIPTDEKSLNALMYRFFRQPKHEPNSQLIFFMTSLVILASSIIIVSGVICVVYYLVTKDPYKPHKTTAKQIYNSFVDEEVKQQHDSVVHPPAIRLNVGEAARPQDQIEIEK